ncbi:hypothetical protein GIB67_023595, partial [Kingdonia uniflora]
VDENICKFAKKGLTPSWIGMILHDSHGMPQMSFTVNKKFRIHKSHGSYLNLTSEGAYQKLLTELEMDYVFYLLTPLYFFD